MHSIESVGRPLIISLTFFLPKLAPPRGLRGSCVEAIIHYVTCLRKHTCLQGFLPLHKCPRLQGGLGRIAVIRYGSIKGHPKTLKLHRSNGIDGVAGQKVSLEAHWNTEGTGQILWRLAL